MEALSEWASAADIGEVKAILLHADENTDPADLMGSNCERLLARGAGGGVGLCLRELKTCWEVRPTYQQA